MDVVNVRAIGAVISDQTYFFRAHIVETRSIRVHSHNNNTEKLVKI